MSTANPYKSRNRLPADSPMFFGRQREMERLTDMISGAPPQNISIVGERRIGKSSMAFRVYHQIKKSGHTLAVYLDCDALMKTCHSDDDFYQLLEQRFRKTLDQDTALAQTLDLPGEALFSGYRELREFTARVSQKNVRVVIFLDEFEHLPEREFADNSFFSNLRALADHPEYALAFVTISKTEIKDLTHKAIQTSSFYNIFDTVMIGLLDHESIKQLRSVGFKEDGFGLTPEDTQRLSFYAGDFAFFNQVACAFLWDAKHYRETPDWDDLEVKLLRYYETMWESRSREEQLLLKGLKKKNKSNNLDLKELKARGLVTKAEDLYYPFSDFFGQLMVERFKVKSKISKNSIKEGAELVKELRG